MIGKRVSHPDGVRVGMLTLLLNGQQKSGCPILRGAKSGPERSESAVIFCGVVGFILIPLFAQERREECGTLVVADWREYLTCLFLHAGLLAATAWISSFVSCVLSPVACVLFSEPWFPLHQQTSGLAARSLSRSSLSSSTCWSILSLRTLGFSISSSVR